MGLRFCEEFLFISSFFFGGEGLLVMEGGWEREEGRCIWWVPVLLSCCRFYYMLVYLDTDILLHSVLSYYGQGIFGRNILASAGER